MLDALGLNISSGLKSGYPDGDFPPPEPEIEAQRHNVHAGLPLQLLYTAGFPARTGRPAADLVSRRDLVFATI